jgi:hypothetical protein
MSNLSVLEPLSCYRRKDDKTFMTQFASSLKMASA